MLAVDMDGTMLKTDKTIAPETVAAIRRADEAGACVALSTGRGPAEVSEYRGELSRVRFAVLISGAYVYDCFEDREVFRTGVRRPEIDRLIELAGKYGGMLHYLTEGESIVSAEDFKHFEDFGMGIYRPLFEANARKVSDMVSESKRFSMIEKVNIYFRSSGIRDEARAELEAEGVPLVLANAEDQSLESSPADAGKGAGLIRLAEYAGIPLEQIAAVGDNENDRTMFEAAGLAIAMGNAPEAIRELCDVVVADNDHDGVGEAIRRYLL